MRDKYLAITGVELNMGDMINIELAEIDNKRFILSISKESLEAIIKMQEILNKEIL